MPEADWLWAGFNPPIQHWLSFYLIQKDNKVSQKLCLSLSFMLNSTCYLWVHMTQHITRTSIWTKSLWVRFNPSSSSGVT